MKGNRQGSLSRLITRRSDQNRKINIVFYFAILPQLVKKVRTDFFDKLRQNRLPLNGRRYFFHISQKVLASENVFGYTVPIPTGVRHSTLCRPPAKDKEEYPLWLAVRQCGDLS